MIARISTNLVCTEEQLWEKLSQPNSLQFVSAPLLSFRPIEGTGLTGEWATGREYALRLYFLNIIPLGRHQIRLVEVNRETNTIQSQESGLLAPVWNHKISFHRVGDGAVRYTDEIEIKAGRLTLPIWLFAHLFYRHRQRRWKILLAK